MIILLVLSVVYIAIYMSYLHLKETGFLAEPLMFLSITFVLVCSISIPVNQLNSRGFLENLDSTRNTIIFYRATNNPALQMMLPVKVIELNEILNTYKRLNHPLLFDLWITDDVENTPLLI